jgi:uncharacterized SAM-binding protein YcdF (DUF218 family)
MGLGPRLAPRARNRNVRRLLAAAALAGMIALLVFRQSALTSLGDFLVVSDPLDKADLIYVLAGDFFGRRVLVGADLGARGYAKTVVLSGGPYANSYEGDMAVDFAVQHGYSRNLFCPLRLDVPSTIDEARALGPFFRRLGARRIILVTSNFHSRRVALVFRLFLPGYDFRVVGAPQPEFSPGAWWKDERSRDLLFSEYRKLAGTLLVRAGFIDSGWSRRQSQ